MDSPAGSSDLASAAGFVGSYGRTSAGRAGGAETGAGASPSAGVTSGGRVAAPGRLVAGASGPWPPGGRFFIHFGDGFAQRSHYLQLPLELQCKAVPAERIRQTFQFGFELKKGIKITGIAVTEFGDQLVNPVSKIVPASAHASQAAKHVEA